MPGASLLKEKLHEFWRHGLKGSLYSLEHPSGPPVLNVAASKFRGADACEAHPPERFHRPGQRFAEDADSRLSQEPPHCGPLNDEARRLVGVAVDAAAKGRRGKADRLFVKAALRCSKAMALEAARPCALEKRLSIDQCALYSYAVDRIVGSDNAFLVNVGLSLLVLYGDPDRDLKQVVRILGLCDDCARYSVENMRRWEKGNDELFELAKRTRGWGRIFAIDAIDPASDEVREWLLFDGVDNDIDPSASSLECYEKAGVFDLLHKDLSEQEFRAVGRIIKALMQGSEFEIYEIEDSQSFLELYISAARKHDLILEDYVCVYYVYVYASIQRFSALAKESDLILRSEACREYILKSVRSGDNVEIADHLGLPYKDDLMQAMKVDFYRLYRLCGYLADEAHLEELLELFRRKIPISAIDDFPLEISMRDVSFEPCVRLHCLLNALYGKMPAGLDVVLKGLTAPVINNRRQSLGILRGWAEGEGSALKALSPKAYSGLERAYHMEPCDDLRSEMKQLLDWECMPEEKV